MAQSLLEQFRECHIESDQRYSLSELINCNATTPKKPRKNNPHLDQLPLDDFSHNIADAILRNVAQFKPASGDKQQFSGIDLLGLRELLTARDDEPKYAAISLYLLHASKSSLHTTEEPYMRFMLSVRGLQLLPPGLPSLDAPFVHPLTLNDLHSETELADVVKECLRSKREQLREVYCEFGLGAHDFPQDKFTQYLEQFTICWCVPLISSSFVCANLQGGNSILNRRCWRNSRLCWLPLRLFEFDDFSI
jgi:hypothetical protein